MLLLVLGASDQARPQLKSPVSRSTNVVVVVSQIRECSRAGTWGEPSRPLMALPVLAAQVAEAKLEAEQGRLMAAQQRSDEAAAQHAAATTALDAARQQATHALGAAEAATQRAARAEAERNALRAELGEGGRSNLPLHHIVCDSRDSRPHV